MCAFLLSKKGSIVKIFDPRTKNNIKGQDLLQFKLLKETSNKIDIISCNKNIIYINEDYSNVVVVINEQGWVGFETRKHVSKTFDIKHFLGICSKNILFFKNKFYF